MALRRFLQAHQPKTGGIWITATFGFAAERTDIGICCKMKSHQPVWAMPEERRENWFIFGTVRNPWAWYPSLYYHAQRVVFPDKGIRLQDLKDFYGNGVDSFREVLYGMTHLSERELPSCPGVLWGLGYEEESHALIKEVNGGLWSWATRFTYSQGPGRAREWAVDVLIDTAHVQEGLEELTGKKLDEYATPKNERPRAQGPADYRDLYDDEMIEWVQAADGELIEEFGYKPFEPAPQATFLFEGGAPCGLPMDFATYTFPKRVEVEVTAAK